MKHLTPKLSLKQFLPYRLSACSYRTSRMIASVYAERFNLRIPEWRVIAVLGELGTTTSKEIAEFTEMDKVAVSRAVTSLVRKTLVSRKINDYDGRASDLRLSDNGIKVYEEICPLALALEAQILDGLDEDEIRKFHALIDSVNNRLDVLVGKQN